MNVMLIFVLREIVNHDKMLDLCIQVQAPDDPSDVILAHEFTFVFNKEKNLQSHHVMIKKNNISKFFIYFFKFLNNFILWDIFGKKKKFLMSYLFFKYFIFIKKNVDI